MARTAEANAVTRRERNAAVVTRLAAVGLGVAGVLTAVGALAGGTLAVADGSSGSGGLDLRKDWNNIVGGNRILPPTPPVFGHGPVVLPHAASVFPPTDWNNIVGGSVGPQAGPTV